MIKKLFLKALLLTATLPAWAQQTPVYLDESKPIEERVNDALSRMTTAEKIAIIHAQSKFSARGVPRLGIPDLWCNDGPHGIRPDVFWDSWDSAGQTNDSCVAFPALTCLAATWNPALSKAYGTAIGAEARYRKKDVLLGPGVNIYRTPLAGRNFEYLGEDPYLAATMVTPYVKGVQSNGVAACVKHFCLNNDEANRHRLNAIVSDRALHEIYLPAFKSAVQEGHAWAVMCAYNYYKSQPLCANEYLLKGILKEKWHFDGVAMTDWGARTTTMDAVKNGLDMEFGTHTDGLHEGMKNAYDAYYLAQPYLKLIQNGTLSTKELDEKARNVLRLHFRTTMNMSRKNGAMCSEAHYQTALKVGQEGIVLLQNKRDLLPMKLEGGRKTVLIVGENAVKMMTVGGGSSSLKAQKEITPIQGLQTRLAGKARILYARGYVGDTIGRYNKVTTGQDLREYRPAKELVDEAKRLALQADYVLIIGGLNKSEHQDAEGSDRLQYGLPYKQDSLITQLAAVNPNTVYINISGNAVAMPWKDRIGAIVQAWYLGSETGNALASVLVGDVNPSGKLPFTWTKTLEDVPAHGLKGYPGTWRKDRSLIDEEYKEGLYVGYRWVDHAHTTPLFAFGHGLSYTTFRLSNLRIDRQEMPTEGQIRLTVNVKNTGKRAGAEVIQLYIHDEQCSVERPYKELKGFAKVALQPGESRDVTLCIDKQALSFYDDKARQWTAEPGFFTALVGNSSDNLPLKARFKLQ